MFMGRNCRHAPTCSEFTRDAIWRFGFWPGGWMGLARLGRCRPGGTHGYDPVPAAGPDGARRDAPWGDGGGGGGGGVGGGGAGGAGGGAGEDPRLDRTGPPRRRGGGGGGVESPN